MPEPQTRPTPRSFLQRPLADPWDGGHGTRDTSCFQMVPLLGQEARGRKSPEDRTVRGDKEQTRNAEVRARRAEGQPSPPLP